MENKDKNVGLRRAHWILIFISAAAAIYGICLCLSQNIGFDTLYPALISIVGIVATIVLDGIGMKREDNRNVAKRIRTEGSFTMGNESRDYTNGDNIAEDVYAKGDVNIGNRQKK